MMTRSAETLLDRVSEAPPAPAGPSWLAELRERAARSLRESGFPHKKAEAWRFTPVDPVVRIPFAPAPADSPPGAMGLAERELAGDDAFSAIVVNGRLAAGGEPPAGVRLLSLARALESDEVAVADHLGRYAPAAYFAALNGALFDDAVILHVSRGAAAERPIHIVHATSPGADPTASYPRVLVVAEPASELRLIETYVGEASGPKHLTCPVTEIAVGEGAAVDHLRVVRGGESGYHVGSLSVHQARSSSYASRSVALGGAITRVDLDVVMDGEGASCVLDGVYAVGGKEHVDHHTFIDHAKPRCSSQEVYRGILDGRGHGVFDGTIAIRKDAQQSAAHQENRNLLLSDDATIHTKPHLQIDADDVSASHGATIGTIEEDALFYLRARGIGEEQARAVLTYAFVKELVDRIPHEASRRRIGAALLERLPHGESLEGGDVLA